MRKYTWYENVISACLGLLVATLAVAWSYRNQPIEPVPEVQEVPIVEEVVPEPIEPVEVEPEPLDPPEPIIEIEPIEPEYLGEFTITAYCACAKCCGIWASKRPDGIVYGASGVELTPGYSIAVDPTVIPYGTIVSLDGKEYIAQDCGGAIKGNKIDLYMATHEEAVEWGKQYHDVYLPVEK